MRHPNEHRKIGLKVAFYRKQRGWTQQQLADSIYIDQQQISRLERGVTGLSLDRIVDVANALGVKPSQLLDFDDMLD